eukprot:gene9000-18634_t
MSRQISLSTTQFSVKAFYIARGIDISSIQTKVYQSSPAILDAKKSVSITINEEKGQYISVFPYGSVVIFNLSDAACHLHIEQIKKEAALSPFLEDLLHTEEYEVVVKTSLEKPSEIRNEHLKVRSLDVHNLQMVSSVMAQTVALDYYEQRVD